MAGTDSYRKRFESVTQLEEYKKFYEILHVFWVQNPINGIYYGMYDKDTSSIVHIVDPDDREGMMYKTGDPEYVDEKDIQKILDWDTNNALPFYTHKTKEYSWLLLRAMNWKTLAA